jgi:hypothetical protein
MLGIADLFEKFNRIFRERLICIFLAFNFCYLLFLYLQHLPCDFDVDLFYVADVIHRSESLIVVPAKDLQVVLKLKKCAFIYR